MNNKTRFIWGHGLFANREFDDEQDLIGFDRLCEHAEVVRYDAKGHGRAPAGSKGSHLWPQLADDMLLYDEQSEAAHQKTILAGQSMGAATALWAALKRERLPDALVLVNPPTAWESRKGQTDTYDVIANHLESLTEAMLVQGLTINSPVPSYLLEHRPQFTADVAKSIYAKAQLEPDGFRRVLADVANSDFPDKPLLKKLTMPCLILAWEGDAAHPLSTANELKALLPNSELYCAADFDGIESWTDKIIDFIGALK